MPSAGGVPLSRFRNHPLFGGGLSASQPPAERAPVRGPDQRLAPRDMRAQPQILLRPARLDDLDYILLLERKPGIREFIDPWSRAHHQAALGDPDECTAIAQLRGRRIGFTLAAGLAGGNSLELRRIAVGRRGAGYGRRVLEAWLAWAATRATRELWLDVYANNARGRRLYTAAGFQESKAAVGPDGRALIVMRRPNGPGVTF
jgi:ribosomal protein S18 acetylase RimI-like enzyme